jgi:hypothetical protein
VEFPDDATTSLESFSLFVVEILNSINGTEEATDGMPTCSHLITCAVMCWL